MPSAVPISANLSLRKGGAGAVGPERIALLQAIKAHGSISGAAKAVGLSYKGAWDAVQALNNLFERPLVVARPGGRRGGRAEVTEDGVAVISAFHAMEAELAHVLGSLEGRLGRDARPLRTLLWSLGMKTSARNALRGAVDRIVPGAVNSEVVLKVADGAEIVAVITKDSVEDLGLAPGAPAIALIKSSFVILARDEGSLRTSARNRLAGVVSHVERGAVNDAVTLDIGGGKSITATITHDSVEHLDLRPGEPAVALIKASHVILAVE
ncbi:MAG TPA: TOBE domain-containing protein [Caulobacteraceae bacterium]|nr:TOBE domain-containing protein [Caulobacteraceae bacterium]